MPAPTSAPVQATSERVPVDDDPSLGPGDAPVTIVVFGDFVSPFCRTLSSTLVALRARYGDKLRVVWKDYPLAQDEHAFAAALTARTVFRLRGAAAFWTVQEALFKAPTVEPALLRALAKQQGLTDDDLQNSQSEADSKIRRSIVLGGELGVNGIPVSLVNGIHVWGAQPITKWIPIVDAQVAAAADLRAQGIAASATYAALVKRNYTPPTSDTTDVPTKVWRVPVGQSPVDGSPDALVTLVVFFGYEDPYSKKFDRTLAELRAKYGAKLRVVYKHYPLFFQPRSLPAAMLAIEAEKQKGFKGFAVVHAKLMEASKLEDTDLSAIAAASGLDTKATMAAVQAMKHRPTVEADTEAGEQVDVFGTPTAFINGRTIDGARDAAYCSKIIDEELVKAAARVKGGLATASVYEATVKDGAWGIPPIAVPTDAPARGGPNAKVVVQYFGGFEDPFTRRLWFGTPSNGADDPSTAALRAVVAKYGDKVRIVLRHFPLAMHKRARTLATFAIEAYIQKGATGFWKVHDDLLLQQSETDDAALQKLATKHGLDWKKCKAAIDGDLHATTLARDIEDGTKLRATGTPMLLIGGRRVVGAVPPAILYERIDRALAATP